MWCLYQLVSFVCITLFYWVVPQCSLGEKKVLLKVLLVDVQFTFVQHFNINLSLRVFILNGAPWSLLAQILCAASKGARPSPAS